MIAVLVAAAFLLSFASISFAKEAEKMAVKGTVTKIEGNMVTVKDDMGKETTVDVKDVMDAKVGDMVKIKGGVIKKLEPKPEKSQMPEKEKSGY
jgi:hypothetical protein